MDIDYDASSTDLRNALRDLDPIPYHGGVEVSKVDLPYEVMWRVTFAGDEVGGDVEAMQCHDYNMFLEGWLYL